MRNKRTFRWTCLGLLCGGLLLTGIGVGVQLVEAYSWWRALHRAVILW